MTNRPSFQDPKKEPTRFPQSVPISTLNPIDRTRIILFLAITFGLTLAPYLVIFLSNGRLNSLHSIDHPSLMMSFFPPSAER